MSRAVDIFKRLECDHIHLQQILTVLEQESERADKNGWRDVDFALIFTVFEYIRAYPEQFHHPLEDSSFDFLLNRELIDPYLIQTIYQQHKNLKIKTANLYQYFKDMQSGEAESSPELLPTIKEFCRKQCDHIKLEEEKIFPLLAEFSDGDWWDIASCIVMLNDPVFENPDRDDFALLAKKIAGEKNHS